MSAESLTQRWLRQNVISYPNKDRVFLDFDTVLNRFSTLRPKSDVYSSVISISPYHKTQALIFLLQPTMMAAHNFSYVSMVFFLYPFEPLHIIFQSPFGSPKSIPANPQ